MRFDDDANYRPRSAPALAVSGQESVANRGQGVIRPVKLLIDELELPAILLDLANEIARIKIFSDIPPHRQLAIELPGGKQFRVVLVWQTGLRAGVFFADPVGDGDLRRADRLRERPARFATSLPTLVEYRQERLAAEIQNLSLDGAGIAMSAILPVGEVVRFNLGRVVNLRARVRWSRGGQHGLTLESRLTYEGLTKLLGTASGRKTLPGPVSPSARPARPA